VDFDGFVAQLLGDGLDRLGASADAEELQAIMRTDAMIISLLQTLQETGVLTSAHIEQIYGRLDPIAANLARFSTGVVQLARAQLDESVVKQLGHKKVLKLIEEVSDACMFLMAKPIAPRLRAEMQRVLEELAKTGED